MLACRFVEALERRRLLAAVPSGFTDSVVASGLVSPTAMDIAPDGRIFVATQSGDVRVIDNGQLVATPFVHVATVAVGERGLLGITLDPNFASNHFVYLYYTQQTPAVHNVVARFTANGDLAAKGSGINILELDNLSSTTNHNGGGIHFGTDGKLYVGVGENATGSNAQTLNNRLGKILRINADGSIPTDNPFYNTAIGANRAIWAIGLRNPYSFAFQRGTGRLFINDVGQNTWEEIDDGIAGSNYGWPTTEGFTNNPSFRTPLFEYGHGSGPTVGDAITGGAFYNPATRTFPSHYVGKYFFCDLTSGWIRQFDPSTNTASNFASGIDTPVGLLTGADGALYYVAQGNGGFIGKIQAVGGVGPVVGTGDGLSVTYFDHINFKGPRRHRVDQTIDFDYGTSRPARNISPDTYSATWQGQIQGQFRERYTFYTDSDDGIRVTLDGNVLIDDLTGDGLRTHSAAITLRAGRKYNFRVDYYQNTGTASAKVFWSSASTAKEIIPRSQLYTLAAPSEIRSSNPLSSAPSLPATSIFSDREIKGDWDSLFA